MQKLMRRLRAMPRIIRPRNGQNKITPFRDTAETLVLMLVFVALVLILCFVYWGG